MKVYQRSGERWRLRPLDDERHRRASKQPHLSLDEWGEFEWAMTGVSGERVQDLASAWNCRRSVSSRHATASASGNL
jgi:hypothetical protein